MTRRTAADLQRIRPGIDTKLEFYRSELQAALEEKQGEGVQNAAYLLSATLRSQGILRYLLDADRQGFFERCYQAALVYELANRLVTAGMPHEEDMYSLTNSRGFFAALLTMGPAELGRVLGSAPREQTSDDDDVQFAFMSFLAATTKRDAPSASSDLARLRKLAEDADAGIELALAEGLHARDRARFVDAMQEFLNRRQEQISQNADVKAGEEYLSIEGLALRRLAAALGIEVQIRHPLTPSDLQESYPDPTTFARGELPEIGPEVGGPGFWEDWAEPETW